MTMDQAEKKILLRVLSLLLAVLIFLFITSETQGEMRVKVPVEYGNVPAGLTLVTQPPACVEMVLAGPRILLLKAKITGLKLQLDLHGLQTGMNRFAEPERFIHLDDELRVKTVLTAVDIMAQPSEGKKPD